MTCVDVSKKHSLGFNVQFFILRWEATERI